MFSSVNTVQPEQQIICLIFAQITIPNAIRNILRPKILYNRHSRNYNLLHMFFKIITQTLANLLGMG